MPATRLKVRRDGDATARMSSVRDVLFGRWLELSRAGGATDDAAVRAAYEDVLARHAEPQRRHHTAEHVADVLQTIRALADPRLPAVDTALATIADYQAVCFAGWLHDVIYDPASSTNEEESAVYAAGLIASLGLPSEMADEVARLIRLTRSHEVATDDVNGMVLIDADLAILAARPKRYDRYARDIRAEYAHVDDDTYRAARAAVLERFLARGSLFNCEVMMRRCDQPARANLRRELATWRG